MISPVHRFPDWMKCDVDVVRGGGTDNRGNPLPSTTIPRKGVMVAPRATSDPVDRSDVTDGRAVLYDGDPHFRYRTSDVISIPDGTLMAGRWKVDGRPGEWVLGGEIGLVPA